MNIFTKISLLLTFLITPQLFAADIIGLQQLPVQDAGRIKPFDTFARETLQLVYGKQKYNGKKATELVFTWMLVPDHWKNEQIILVRHNGLREALNLDKIRLLYSPEELMLNEKVGLTLQELRNKLEAKEKLNPYFQAVQTLENQLSIFQAIRFGKYPRIVPHEESEKAWLSPSEFGPELQESFSRIGKVFTEEIAEASDKAKLDLSKNTKVDEAVNGFVRLVLESYPNYFKPNKIKTESFYNNSSIFMWSWILYLIATILCTLLLVLKKPVLGPVSQVFTYLALALHTAGFGLRSYIIERAPVTNMFETVVWVAWGAVFFGLILHYMKKGRGRFYLLGANTVATLCLILTDLSSQVLDSSLTPLEPVLRDNFWLLTHVLIITLSYAAFFLAFFIGDILLFYFIKGPKSYNAEIRDGVDAIYKSIQIGVVLLAAGTILGGIWADYSWGRFWGWDPKETWAFIALMGYLAILHARLTGWLKSFGMAIGAVISFSLVIMAWYGVNFVLGAGLHTYGFGAGGVEYVSGFVAVHLILCCYAFVLQRNRQLSK